MTRKKIVVFWGKNRRVEKDPLLFLGESKRKYYQLFDIIDQGADLYVVVGLKNWMGGLVFENSFLYTKAGFIKHAGEIRADSVWDRSASRIFPEKSRTSNKKVLNCSDFKELARDKWATYEELKEFSPETFLAEDRNVLNLVLEKNFDPQEKVVIKPRFGMKGNQVWIDTKDNLGLDSLLYPVVIQKFVNTEGLFENHKERAKDLRIGIVGDKMSYTGVRIAPPGKLISNLAKGGVAVRISPEEIPVLVNDITDEIISKFSKKYYSPYYSIDYGIDNNQGRVFIIEINSQIVMPPDSLDSPQLIRDLAELLIRKAA